MKEGFKWILESKLNGKVCYLARVEYTGKKWIFGYSDDMSKALRYPNRKRADDDCEFFNRRGDAHCRRSMAIALEADQTFSVVDIGIRT